MPIVMLLIGGLLGTIIGGVLAGGMAALAGLPVYGPITTVFAALLAMGPTGIGPIVVHPIVLLFGAGLALLVAFIFMYAFAAISVIAGVALGEFFSRGLMIGASSGANFVIFSAMPFTAPFAGIIFIITLLALIPPIAANRFYQRVLGALGWVLPLNYLMLPVGVLVFLITAPFAVASPAVGAGVRWDWLTWTAETSGGLLLVALPFAGGFNIGNFTFITRPALATAFTYRAVGPRNRPHAEPGAHSAGSSTDRCRRRKRAAAAPGTRGVHGNARRRAFRRHRRAFHPNVVSRQARAP